MDRGQASNTYEEDWALAWRKGDWEQARSLAVALRAAERTKSHLADLHIGRADIMTGWWHRAIEHLQRAAEGFHRSGNVERWVEARCELVHAQRGSGQIFSALETARSVDRQLRDASVTRDLPLATKARCHALVEVETAQCVGQLGDRDALRRRCGRAEAYADLCSDTDLQTWIRVVGSRPLASAGRSHTIEEARERTEAAIAIAIAHNNPVLEIRARFHRIQAEREAKPPGDVQEHINAIQAHVHILERTPRFREQFLQARINHLLLSGRHREALALSLADEDAPPDTGETPEPIAPRDAPCGSRLWRLQYWRRQLKAAELLNLRGFALDVLLHACAYQAKVEPSKLESTDFQFATRRWFDKSKAGLEQQLRRVPSDTEEYGRLKGAKEQLLSLKLPGDAQVRTEGQANAPDPRTITELYEGLRLAGENLWRDVYLPGGWEHLSDASKGDLIQSYISYELCFDDLGRVALLLARVLERELRVVVTDPLRTGGKLNSNLRKKLSNLSLKPALEALDAICSDGPPPEGAMFNTKHREALRDAAASIPWFSEIPQLKAIVALGETSELAKIRNAHAHASEWDAQPVTRRQIDELLIGLVVKDTQPLLTLAKLAGRARSHLSETEPCAPVSRPSDPPNTAAPR